MRRLAAAVSAVAALLCVSAIPAQATQATQAGNHPFTRGKVHVRQGGIIRSGPGTRFRISGHLRDGEVVPLICKSRGQSVRRNHVWYLLGTRPAMWASSTFILNLDKSPVWCAQNGPAVHPTRHHHRRTAPLILTPRHHRKTLHHHHIVRKIHGRLTIQRPTLPQNDMTNQNPQNPQTSQHTQNTELPGGMQRHP